MTAIRTEIPEATAQAAGDADPAARPWSHDQMLLAAAVDTMRELVWLYSTVNSGSSTRVPRPDPIIRPGVTGRPRKVLTVAAYRQLTGQDPPLHLIHGEGGS